MHEDASYQTYADFGQNRGRYVTGTRVNALLQHIREDVDKGITIHYTDGTAPYTISNEQGMINFSGTDDIGAQVAVSPTFAATVLHNGSINASYGEREVGRTDAINYDAIDIRHSNVFRLAPASGTGQYDYMLQRQSKIVTDASYNPVTTITDMGALSGQHLYHSGAGSMGMRLTEGGSIGLAGPYTYIIGAINKINSGQTHAGTTNTSLHQDPGYAGNVGASVDNPLPNAVQGGDSGSPVFIYNEASGQYEYLAAQQSGGGHSYSQARGNVEWTHSTLDSFNVKLNSGAGAVVKLGAIDVAGESYTDNQNRSTQIYRGIATDSEGNELGRYRGVQTGKSTWKDLSPEKDKSNWYAYTGYLNQPVTDLFFNDNLVITAGAAENTVELQSTVDLGVGYVEFSPGVFEKADFHITSADPGAYLLNSAGYVINKGASVHISFTNPENYMYEWRKTGAGDLYIEGSGDTNALLALGGSGVTYLNREGGHAAYNVLASSGATVVIADAGQIERDFTFGAGGGTLDVNGTSMDWYTTTTGEGHFTINALTEQAFIVNNSSKDATLTYREGGNQAYLGSWQDSEGAALRIDYNGGGTWVLNSIHTDLTRNAGSGLTVSSGTVRLEGIHTVHGMGSAVATNATRAEHSNDWHYADAAMDVTVRDGAVFELGSHARLRGDVTVEQGATFVMHEGVQNQYEYVEGGALLEDTYRYADYWGLKGDVALAGAMRVEYSAGTTANTTYDYSISGNGSLTVAAGTQGGTLTLSGDNSAFTGEKRITSGGVIATGTQALGNTTENKWLLDAAGWLTIKGETSPAALLSHVDGSSSGTLVLASHMTMDFDLSAHRGLYIGAARDTKLMYGDMFGTTLQAVDGAWRLGGGGGELLVNYRLSGNNNLLLGADAGSVGTVTLRNERNDFTGQVMYNSRGVLLRAGQSSLGAATVQLDYGNRLISPDAGVVSRIDSSSEGMLMVDELGNASLSLGNHAQVSLAAQTNATLRGSVALAEGAAYRFGAADGATLRVETSLEQNRDIVVDAQGYSGGKVVLAGNEQLDGAVTVRGNRDSAAGGDITLALGRDIGLSGVLTLEKGSRVDVAGNTLTVSNNIVSNGGPVIDTAGSGELVFDASERELSSNAALQLASVRKTGDNTLLLQGNNSFRDFFVDAGTLKLANSNAAGSATIHLADATTLNIGSGAFSFNLAMAENAGTATVVQNNGGTTTLRGNMQLGSGSRLNLNGTGIYALSGSQYGGEGAVVSFGAAELHFRTNSAVTIAGTLSAEKDILLFSDGTASNMARNINELHISNASTVTLDEMTWNTVWNIGSLTGEGKLLWNSLTTHDKTSRLILSREGDFTGDIELKRWMPNSSRSHGAIIELAHDRAAQNATFTLNGQVNYSNASLAINTGNAIIRGLSGTSLGYVYAGAAPVSADIPNGSRPATTRAAVLSIDTAAGKEYTYAGVIGHSSDTAARGLSLVKLGQGTQNMTGSVSVNDITVHAGRLSLNPGALTVRGDVAVAGGATLSMGNYTLGEGRSFSVLAGEAALPAEFAGELILAGGNLNISSTSLAQAQVNGTAVFNVQGARFADGISSQTLVFDDFCHLELGTYTLAGGDWSSVAAGLSADGLVVYDSVFSAAENGALQITLSRAAGLYEWNGGSTGTWNQADASWLGEAGQTFVNGQSAYFSGSATVTVTEGMEVQNLAIGEDTQLTTQGAVRVNGVVRGGDGSVWNIAAGNQSLTEAQAAGVERLQVARDATLSLTGTPTAAALDNVSGAGTVVLSYGMNGNGTGFDFSGLTGKVQLNSGRILVSSSTFGDRSPTIALQSGNSQLVFNGEGTVLRSDVELAASTTVHVNNGKTGTMAGVICGTGGLTKAGAGELTLTAQNTYTGATNVTGRLVLDLASGAGAGTYDLYNQVKGGTLAVQAGTTLATNGNNIGSTLELNGANLLVTGGNTTITGPVTAENSRITLGRAGAQTYTDGGILTFAGRVNGTATKVDVGQGQVVFAYTGADGNSVSTIDAGLGGKSVGQAVVKSGARLDVTDAIYLSSEDGAQAAVQLEKGAVLTHAGLAVTGNRDAEPAALKANQSRGQYNVGSSSFTVAGAQVAKTAEQAMTLGNRLENVQVQNAAEGRLTVTNAANTLTGVQASGGDIAVHNQEKLNLELLHVASGRTVAAWTGASAGTRAEISVSGLASFESGAVLQANLVLAEGSILNLDGPMTLSGSLTLGADCALAGGTYDQLFTMQTGDKLVLMSGLTSLTLGDTVVDGSVPAAVFLANLPETCYLVYEAGLDSQGGTLSLTLAETPDSAAYQAVELPEFGSYSSGVSIAAASAMPVAHLVPEPATATLSLLALAALAARRRRS